MLHQDIPGLDFSTYFDVSNQLNNQLQTDEQQSQLVYNTNDQSSIHPKQPLNTPSFETNQSYFQQNTQPTYDMLNWCLKEPQGQQQQQQQASIPAPTPQVVSPSRPDYFFSAPQINSGKRTSLEQIQKQQSILHEQHYNNNNNNGLPTPMSDVMFPETPHSRTSMLCGESSSSPLNPKTQTTDKPDLSNAFAAIENWGKYYGKVNSIHIKDDHEAEDWKDTKCIDPNTNDISSIVAHTVAAVAAKSASSPDILETGHHLRKVAHNAIERRYRNNINDRIKELRNVVPALQKACSDSSDDESIVDGVQVAKKLNKATILHKATEYIHHLKHNNALADRENQILQQIVAQMPGGTEVLARFQAQKQQVKQAEEIRLQHKRKASMEREKLEHQRMLRERAAQRSALAEILPKPPRRPYRRRAKTQNKESNDSIKSYLAVFLCLVMASPLSFKNTAGHHTVRTFASHLLTGSSSSQAFDFWSLTKMGLLIIALSYIVIQTIKHIIKRK